MQKLSDVYPTVAFPDLDKIEVDDLLGRELTIVDIMEMKGKHGIYLTVKFNEGGDTTDKKFVSGGVVIVERLQRAKADNNLPILATISKEEEYYTIG